MHPFRASASAFVPLGLFLGALSFGQVHPEKVDHDIVAKINDEGLKRSQVMETISFLTDVHGPRLTGSPLTRAAGEWTKSRLTQWGLANVHFESWGPFGRGWTLEAFSANMLQPSYSPLIAYPKAWSPSTPKTVRSEPIYLDASTEADLEKYRGKLLRAIVLISPPREVKAQFEAPAKRQTDESLLALANADASLPRSLRSGPQADSGAASNGAPPSGTGEPTSPSPPAVTSASAGASSQPASPAAGASVNSSSRPPSGWNEQRTALQLQSKKWQLVYDEGAAVVLEPGRGDGGTVFVGSATLPRRGGVAGENRGNAADGGREGASGDNSFGRGPRPWAVDSPDIVPQAVLAVEHYNRIVRMLKKGTPVQLEIDIASRYHTDDLSSFNILAEIPGTDLKDEIVMLGGHFDSWHAGTGATDNAVGCGVALEAVRILQAIGVKPRRTIRLALWTGEEQGLLGSRAYVAQHFGRMLTPARGASTSGGDAGPAPGSTAAAREEPPRPSAQAISGGGNGATDHPVRERPKPQYELKPAHAKCSAYFNLDNGTGKIRGVHLQGNEALRPIFRAWLTPFADVGASTLTQTNTGGTDHLSFDGIGLPGFQFIQDPLEYSSRTHHSSMDVYDRIQEDDVKQASIIMASFVYHAAMRDEKLPRKPLGGEVVPASAEPDNTAASKSE